MHTSTHDRIRHAPLQFRMFLMNAGVLAGWLMILLAVLIVLILAPSAY